ncbi:LysR substrate-binding domain-containing protein [Rhizobium oryzicola]|uniref:LysR substrate-binding domain-containing protein n=1 Tax=Rhizobium oryzicola TaxID=1232668 RepID=A0ABT8SVV3_9HYPH|nr:LysR substrate-binding domain-containing protein [Rhizobium oryzicola]MDO1582565.1 LysR substrate-binding domain-containing protein [Rhizobium oryzicola]
MNFRQIEIFAAIMKTGTASKAAELLDITQPAASRALSDLESDLGFLLFDRVRQRLQPTPEAWQFYKSVEASFRGLDTIKAEAARIRDQGSGRLRIASLALLGSTLVPRSIARFRTRHPDINVTLHVLVSRDVRDLVASGQFDVGLAADEIDITGLNHQLFLSPQAMIAMPVGHPLAARETIRPHDLIGFPFVSYVPEDRARQRFDAILSEAGVKLDIVVETIYASTVCALVTEGVGLGLVSPYVVSNLDKTRVALRPFEPAVSIKTLLILPPDKPKSLLVRDFITALMESR